MVNRMISSHIKHYLGGVMEKVLQQQMSHFQEYIFTLPQLNQIILNSNLNSNGGGSNVVLGGSFSIPNSLSPSNSHGSLAAMASQNSYGSSPNVSPSSSPNTRTSSFLNVEHNTGSVETISGHFSGSLVIPHLSVSGAGIASSSSISSHSLTTSVPSNNSQYSFGAIHSELVKCTNSIINTILRSFEKIPLVVLQMFQVVDKELSNNKNIDSIEFIKKLFFSKLVCPIIANFKSSNSIISKIFIELSKILSDVISNKDISTKLPIGTSEQVDQFLLKLVGRQTPSLNIDSTTMTTTTPTSTTQPIFLSNSVKEESFQQFTNIIKGEFQVVEEQFRKLGDERNVLLLGLFKEVILTLRLGQSLTNQVAGSRSSMSPFQTLKNPLFFNPSAGIGTKGDMLGGSGTRIINLTKKFNNDELKNSYNGKSQKKRANILERKPQKNQVINLFFQQNDGATINRLVNVPSSLTIQALCSRIPTDIDFSDLGLTNKEYEIYLKYSDDSCTVTTESKEILCEPELPLWMYDIDSDTVCYFRPVATLSGSANANKEKHNLKKSPFTYLKFIFPNPNGSYKSIIHYVDVLSTPQIILKEHLSKYISIQDPNHLGFYLLNINEDNLNTSQASSNNFANNLTNNLNNIATNVTNNFINSSNSNNNSFSNNSIQKIPSDGKLLSVSTMDVIQVSPLYSYEFNSSLLFDGDTTIEDLINSLVHNITVQQQSPSMSLSSSSNSQLTVSSQSSHHFNSKQYLTHSLALISNSKLLPMFLPNHTKLSDYFLRVGDEIIVTSKDFVPLKEDLESSKNFDSPVKGKFSITWKGPVEPTDNLLPSYLNTLNNTTSNTIGSINNSNSFEKPLLSNNILQEITCISNTKFDYCINNQVKLCIVGDESFEKLGIYNSLRKSNLKPRETIVDMSANSLSDSCIIANDWQCDQTFFKLFYFNGLEIFQPFLPFFISPQSIFIVTYNPLNINTAIIKYWLEIIQTKAKGSVIYLVGITSDDKTTSKIPIKENQDILTQLLTQFNANIGMVDISLINFKNQKQVKVLSQKLQSTANQKPFSSKIPLSHIVLKHQCLDAIKTENSKLNASQKNQMLPITSIQSMKLNCRVLGIEPRDLDDALKYLYQCGDILLFMNEADGDLLKNLVFLDHQWMSKLLASIHNLRHQNGMLLPDRIKNAWGDFPIEQHKYLLTLLEKLEIMHNSIEDSSMVIPMLFSEEKPPSMEEEWPSNKFFLGIGYKLINPNTNNSPFPSSPRPNFPSFMGLASPSYVTKVSSKEYQRIYQFQFLPKGFFSRLSVKLLQLYNQLYIWNNGMVITNGQLWGGASNANNSQCCIEYMPNNYMLYISIRDDQNGELLKSLTDIISSFIMWYFPGRLNDVHVVCTECNEVSIPMKLIEKDAAIGRDHTNCTKGHKVSISSLAYELTMQSNKFSVIPHSDLKFGPKIGAGSYANVYRGLWNQSDVAIKALIQDADDNTEKYREFRNEAQITGELQHENIVSLKCVTLNPFCIVTELLQFGDLNKFIHNSPDPFTWGLVFKLAIDIAKGMNFLHSCKPIIVHRDLKSANILLGGQSHDSIIAKVSDFGLSIKPMLGNEVKGRSVFNWRWLAPEIMKNNQYTEKVDVYSYGIILWEIVTRDSPFEEVYDQYKWNSILEEKIINGLRPDIPSLCPVEMKNLISDCWSGEPKKRPTFQSIIDSLEKMQSSFKSSERVEFQVRSSNTNSSSTDNQVLDFNNDQLLATQNISMNESIIEPYSVSANTSFLSQISEINIMDSYNSPSNIIDSLTSASEASNQSSDTSNEAISFSNYLQSGTLHSSVHSLLYVNKPATLLSAPNECQVWAGFGDGSISVYNSVTKATIHSVKIPEASRITGMIAVKKKSTVKGLLASPTSNVDDTQVWTYYSEGILIFETRAPFKLIKTIKVSYVSFLLDIGDSVLANCRGEKLSSIRVISKTKLKSKKTLTLKNIDVTSNQITSFLLSGSRLWVGTDKGGLSIYDYPSMNPIHNSLTNTSILTSNIHTIKKFDSDIYVGSERLIAIYNENGDFLKKVDNFSSRLQTLLYMDDINYLLGTGHDGVLCLWDIKHGHKVVDHLKKNHSDTISSSTLVLNNKHEVWLSSLDRKILIFSKLDINSLNA